MAALLNETSTEVTNSLKNIDMSIKALGKAKKIYLLLTITLQGKQLKSLTAGVRGRPLDIQGDFEDPLTKNYLFHF